MMTGGGDYGDKTVAFFFGLEQLNTVSAHAP